MALDGYLLYGNIRDRRYAPAVGNVSNIAAGGLMLFEASKGAALLASGGKAAAGWKLATLGTGSVAVPLAVAVGLGIVGAWAIEAAGRKRAHRIVREGVRRVLPGLYDSHFKYKGRAAHAWVSLKYMASGRC